MLHRDLKLVLFAAPVVLVFLHLYLFWTVKDKALAGYPDFAFMYAAAQLVRGGSGTNLYDFETQKRVQEELFASVETRKTTLVFNHPPFEALMFVPLSYLSYARAYILWAAINLLMLFALPLLLAPYVSGLKDLSHPFVMLSFLSFYPVFITVLQGQLSVLLVLLLTLAFINLKQGRDLRAGGFLALTLLRFQFTLPFMLPFLLKRRWKVLLGFSLAAAALVVLSLQITGWKGMVDYFALLWKENRNLTPRGYQQMYAIYPEGMPNIRGFLYTLCAGRLSEVYVKLAVVVFSAFLLLWASIKWMRSPLTGTEALDLRFSLNLSVALLVSYHLLVHDLSLLALPILLVLNHRVRAQTCPGVLRFGLPVVCALFFLTPLYLTLMRWNQLDLLFWPLLLFAIGTAMELSQLEKQAPSHATRVE